MASVKGIAANAGEKLRASVVLPDATAGSGAVEGERRWTRDSSKEIRIGSGLNPTQVLDTNPGRVRFEPENRHPEPKIEQGDPALAIGGGEEEVRAR